MLKIRECVIREKYKDVEHLVSESMNNIHNMFDHIKKCGCDEESPVYEKRLEDLLHKCKYKKDSLSMYGDGDITLRRNGKTLSFSLLKSYINETNMVDRITNISADATIEDYISMQLGENYIEACKFVDVLAIGGSDRDQSLSKDNPLADSRYHCIVVIDDIYLKFMSELRRKGKTDNELVEYLTSSILTKIMVYIEHFHNYVSNVSRSANLIEGLTTTGLPGESFFNPGLVECNYTRYSIKKLGQMLVLLYVNNTLNGRYTNCDVISINKWINEVSSLVSQSYSTNVSEIANIMSNLVPSSLKGNGFMEKIVRAHAALGMKALQTRSYADYLNGCIDILGEAIPTELIANICDSSHDEKLLTPEPVVSEDSTQAIGESLGYKYMSKMTANERKLFILYMERYRLLESRSEFAYDKWTKDSTIKYATDLQLDLSEELNDKSSPAFTEVVNELLNQTSEVMLLLSNRNISKERYVKLFGQVALPEDYNY